MRLTARALKVTLMLDAQELAALPEPTSARIVLQIAIAGGRTVNADIAAKALRKAKATIAEAGVDGVVCIIQGKLLADGAIEGAGLVAQPKTPKAATQGNSK